MRGDLRKDGEDVVASVTVGAARSEIFEFLERLENHCALAEAKAEIVGFEGPAEARSAGRVVLRGPAGVHREARIRLTDRAKPAWIAGTAVTGPKTIARIRWDLSGKDGRTQVTLRVRVVETSVADRVLLAIGGRRWLRGLFEQALQSLKARFEPQAPARAALSAISTHAHRGKLPRVSECRQRDPGRTLP